jgi:hypothetical protein
MRVRSAVFLVSALVAAGCSGKHADVRDPASLKMLGRISAGGSNFGVILDAKTGKALSAFRVNHAIRAAVPDGEGGWYIGGGFVHVNGVLRKRLAHIRADGTLDPSWRPEANGNGVSVTALARIGSRLYVGGDFAMLDHAHREHLGAIDVHSGKLDTRWQPPQNRPFWNNVFLPAGRRLIVGGGGGLPVSSIVALDAATGKRDPTWRGDVDSSNLEGGGTYLLGRSGPRIYVGGVFKAVDGVSRTALAALDADSGRLDKAWEFPKGVGYALLALAVGNDRLYGSINGPSRYALVALDAKTGRLDSSWHARLTSTTGIYGGINAYALEAVGSRVYVAGDFDHINGKPRHGFAALDAKTARVLPAWSPDANAVYASFLGRSGSRILLGIQLSREVSFDFTGLKTFRPVRRLKVLLALSGPGSVRVGLGRHCNYERWTERARCSGRVFRWLGSVEFPKAARRHYEHALGLSPGRYFVRFVPRATGGSPQSPYDFPIKVP